MRLAFAAIGGGRIGGERLANEDSKDNYLANFCCETEALAMAATVLVTWCRWR